MKKNNIFEEYNYKLGDFQPVYDHHHPLSEAEQKIIDDFHGLYFRLNEKKSGLMLSWMGYQTGKVPGDLWIYQELLFLMRPDIIIECGTHKGGSALYLSHMCQLLDHGHVISIDLYPKENRPSHDKLTYINGSSTSSEVVEQVHSIVTTNSKILVILDSDHTREHVLKELTIYSELIPVGGYLIVEDSFLNGHPSHGNFGAGPTEAIEEFLDKNSNFSIDRSLEKFLFTLNPKGFLKRIS
jgi:cephalosporin hydroxylase